MKIEPMKLERWLLRPCEIDVGGGGVTKLKLEDVTTSIDYKQTLGYGPTNGSLQIRQEISDWFPGTNPDNVLVTSATSEANLIVNLALLTPGDEYVAVMPEYGQTVPVARSLGCTTKTVLLNEDTDWELNLEHLKETVSKKTKIVFFNNPNNPTGALLTSAQMKSICEIASDVDANVVCDNALRGSEFDGKPTATPFEHYEKGIVTGSLSKLGITSFRIGWLIANNKLVDDCWKFKDYTTLSHSAIGEYLATIALRRENRERYIKRNLAISKANCETLSNWVNANSGIVSWSRPKASFTAFLKYKFDINSEGFCERLLAQEKVLVSPGTYFGVDNHIRFNIGCKSETVTEALQRLSRFMGGLPQKA
ncbi:MAG: aminotransferase class I/II-fold pyridoxal phosphate-dependent enzyme [Candidatus Bathyarchaeia archaeon]